MARPKSKPELLQLSQENFNKLNTYIDSLSSNVQKAKFPKGTLNRNIRDVLAHLYHWHLMFLDWYEVGMRGDKPNMPAKGYSWKMTPELNTWIQKNYSTDPLDEIRTVMNQTHDKIQKLIEGHSNEELFEKKRYHWTGSTSLGAYLVSTTSSHYDWALKLIKKLTK